MTKKDILYKSVSKISLNISIAVFVVLFLIVQFEKNINTSVYIISGGIVVMFLYALFICHQTNYFSLLNKSGQMAAYAYTVILWTILYSAFGSSVLLSGFVIIFYYLLFISYDNKYASKQLTLAGLILGIMAIYRGSVFYILPVLCLSLLPQKAFSMRNTLALLCFSVMPYFFFIPVMYIEDRLYIYKLIGCLIDDNFGISIISFDVGEFVAVVFWATVLIINIVFYMIRKYKSRIDNIRNQDIINSNNIFIYGILLLSPILSDRESMLSLVLMPTVINISHNVFSLKPKVSSILIIVLNIILIVLFFCINYFDLIYDGR